MGARGFPKRFSSSALLKFHRLNLKGIDTRSDWKDPNKLVERRFTFTGSGKTSNPILISA